LGSDREPVSRDVDVEVAIIGTGFAGLCMAIALQRQGRHDFVLLERADEVGGTWRDNHYPGAACDVPSHLYSLSFVPNTQWSRVYPTQPELLAYLREVADRFGLRPHIRFGHELRAADWDDARQCWRLTTSGGVLRARRLVAGNGGLSEPKAPALPGLERFGGVQFHSATWNHDYALAGKRVAVIGTGASAVQFVPEIAREAGRVDVYQRTPNWIVPRLDRAYRPFEKWAFRHLPGVRAAYRALIYWRNETRVLGFVVHPALMRIGQRAGEQHIAAQISDPVLRARVTPSYAFGCKRVLISNDWYPALQRPNVELVTSPIREVVREGVIDDAGNLREVDAMIFATGFYATENPIAARIRGAGGQSLAQAWQGGEQAYLGTLVHGFPNLFFIVGPNTGLGHNSMVFMIETQVAYIMRLLRLSDAHDGAAIEVRDEVQRRFNDELQQRLGSSIWASGCNSWYQHASGKITALWPGFTFSFWRRTRAFAVEDYALLPAAR
jgi:cation diffusion facilitator CzcD-associated flavoprotein CzcO